MTEVDFSTSLRGWQNTAKCRIEEIKSLEDQNKEDEKQRLQKVKNIVDKKGAGVQLFNLGNALVWWFSVEKIMKILLPNTRDLEYVQIPHDSIANKADLTAVRSMSKSKEIINYVKVKYLKMAI